MAAEARSAREACAAYARRQAMRQRQAVAGTRRRQREWQEGNARGARSMPYSKKMLCRLPCFTRQRATLRRVIAQERNVDMRCRAAAKECSRHEDERDDRDVTTLHAPAAVRPPPVRCLFKPCRNALYPRLLHMPRRLRAAATPRRALWCAVYVTVAICIAYKAIC